MSDEAHRLFRLAIDAYVEGDEAMAAALDDMDDALDELHRDYIAARSSSRAGPATSTSRPRCSWRSSAGTTSASATTPSTSASGSATWSPAGCPSTTGACLSGRRPAVRWSQVIEVDRDVAVGDRDRRRAGARRRGGRRCCGGAPDGRSRRALGDCRPAARGHARRRSSTAASSGASAGSSGPSTDGRPPRHETSASPRPAWHRALEAIPQGVVICDESGEVVFRNRRSPRRSPPPATARRSSAPPSTSCSADALDGLRRPAHPRPVRSAPADAGAHQLPARRRPPHRRRRRGHRRHHRAPPARGGAPRLRRQHQPRAQDPGRRARPAGRDASPTRTTPRSPAAWPSGCCYEAIRVGRTIDDLLELSRIEAEEPHPRGAGARPPGRRRGGRAHPAGRRAPGHADRGHRAPTPASPCSATAASWCRPSTTCSTTP